MQLMKNWRSNLTDKYHGLQHFQLFMLEWYEVSVDDKPLRKLEEQTYQFMEHTFPIDFSSKIYIFKINL